MQTLWSCTAFKEQNAIQWSRLEAEQKLCFACLKETIASVIALRQRNVQKHSRSTWFWPIYRSNASGVSNDLPRCVDCFGPFKVPIRTSTKVYFFLPQHQGRTRRGCALLMCDGHRAFHLAPRYTQHFLVGQLNQLCWYSKGTSCLFKKLEPFGSNRFCARKCNLEV